MPKVLIAGSPVPTVTLRLYEVPPGFFGGSSVAVANTISVTITDDDTLLHVDNSADPGTDQVFTSPDGTITSHQMLFNISFEYTPAGSSTPITVQAKALSLTIDGVLRYYLMPVDGPVFAGLDVGAIVRMISRTSYTELDYAQIACFARGTRIAVPGGWRRVEALRVGDRVATRDAGPCVIRWIGRADLGPAELAARPEFLPVRVRAGALGPGVPARALRLSPQHRLLLTGWRVQLFFGESEVLAPVKHLLGWPGIEVEAECRAVSYVHLMCEGHQILNAEGAPAESLYFGDRMASGLPQAQVEEITALFPELAKGSPAPARPFARGYEVAVLGGGAG